MVHVADGADVDVRFGAFEGGGVAASGVIEGGVMQRVDGASAAEGTSSREKGADEGRHDGNDSEQLRMERQWGNRGDEVVCNCYMCPATFWGKMIEHGSPEL